MKIYKYPSGQYHFRTEDKDKFLLAGFIACCILVCVLAYEAWI